MVLAMSDTRVIGVDVGGSGVKAALVDVERGELTSDRPRLDTPQPATPERVLGGGFIDKAFGV